MSKGTYFDYFPPCKNSIGGGSHPLYVIKAHSNSEIPAILIIFDF